MSPTVSQFVDRLSEAGILPADEVQALIDGMSPGGEASDCSVLARKLIALRKLTDYQVGMLTSEEPGPLWLGEYMLLEQLGTGGMATVYRAQHRGTGQIVALKVLHADVAATRESSYRFDREVQAAAKLNHPNIVMAIDAVVQEGVQYMVMEFVPGMNLAQYVKKVGPLPVLTAVNFIYQAARGLEHAHSKRLVHRDIKPENLLVDEAGTVKILDMGIVRFVNAPRLGARPDEVERLTQVGTMLGTADFMAPEQSSDPRQADYRSDIYSLGCTLYFLLTAKSPFGRETTMATLMAHQTEQLPMLSSERPDVPHELQNVFAKMMAKNPRDRYQDIGELLLDLDPFVQGTLGGFSLSESKSQFSSGLSRSQTSLSSSSRKRQLLTSGPPPQPPRRRKQRLGFVGFLFGIAFGMLVGAALAWIDSQYGLKLSDIAARANLPIQVEPWMILIGMCTFVGGLLGLLFGELAST